MRNLNQFTAREWLRLVPWIEAAKQMRNDALLARYLRSEPAGLQAFLAAHAHLRGRDIAIVIAFQQPWPLDWLLASAKTHLPGTTVVVLDNSRDAAKAAEVRAVCAAHAAPYLALPPYTTRHVNRSHGMAMSWAYHRVVAALAPRNFGFLDHDLIPVGPVDFVRRLADQPAYGLLNAGRFTFWSIWAGYCLYRYAHVQGRPLNFLYDFSRGLDTGGRNWDPLYSAMDRQALRFAPQVFTDVRLPNGHVRKVEVVDGCWVHMGGVGYNDNFETKIAFFRGLRAALEGGATLESLRA
jgi:hypothetical protein